MHFTGFTDTPCESYNTSTQIKLTELITYISKKAGKGFHTEFQVSSRMVNKP